MVTDTYIVTSLISIIYASILYIEKKNNDGGNGYGTCTCNFIYTGYFLQEHLHSSTITIQ